MVLRSLHIAGYAPRPANRPRHSSKAGQRQPEPSRALSRSLAALLENHQTERGTVRIPEALVPYVDGMREILPG